LNVNFHFNLKQFAVLFFIIAAWALSSGGLSPKLTFGAEIAGETIITQNSGGAQEDVYMAAPEDLNHSDYFSNSIAAFCISDSSEVQNLYLLDAMNGRIKKFTTEGNFISIIKINSSDEVKLNELCGIYSAGGNVTAVHSQNSILTLNSAGEKILKLNFPAGFECRKILKMNEKTITAYDYDNSIIARFEITAGSPELKKLAEYEDVLFPWLISNERFLSCSLISPDSLFVYGRSFSARVKNEAYIKLKTNEAISQFKIIGSDAASNIYLRYCTGIIENIAVISPDLRLIETIVFEAKHIANRANLLYDECVGRDGSIYAAYHEKNKLIIKKLIKK